MINTLYIFINPHTPVIPLLEAIELYTIIWQAVHAAMHTLFPLHTLDDCNTHKQAWSDFVNLEPIFVLFPPEFCIISTHYS